ncbi:disulfide-isomerase-like [Sarracenia purpurea var. burkii]
MLFLNFSDEHADAFESKYRDVAEQYKGKGISFLIGDVEASEGAFQTYSFRTFVRGHDITFDLPTLRAYMGLLAPLPDAYPPIPADRSYTFG